MANVKLSRGQRQRLLDGNFSPMVFDVKPYGCDPGNKVVLVWSRPTASHVDGVVVRPPKEALLTLHLTSVKRRPDGRWLVRFDVTDRRDPERFLRATPPVMQPGAPEHGDGSEESHYQTTRWGAVDELSAPRRDWVDKHSKERADRFSEQKAVNDIGRLEAAIASLRLQVADLGVDGRSELRVLERRLQEKIRRRAA